jgi:hypothetical protein
MDDKEPSDSSISGSCRLTRASRLSALSGIVMMKMVGI